MYVITGGATGIGQALALALAAQNKSVLIVGRTAERLINTAKLANQIQYCVADVSTDEGREMIVSRLENIKIEGLIHNAGIIEPIEKIDQVSPNDWENIIHINLFSPFRLTQLLLNQLKGGRVLHIGSGAAYFPVVGWSGYCVSKAALAMLTRCYQAEIQDPLFASIMPGITNTAMTATIRNSAKAMAANQHQFHQRLYDQGRLLEPETVGAFLIWLLLEVDNTTFVSQEWDIYDTSHHAQWLRAPHKVHPLDN